MDAATFKAGGMKGYRDTLGPSEHAREPGCRCDRPILDEDTCLLCGHTVRSVSSVATQDKAWLTDLLEAA